MMLRKVTGAAVAIALAALTLTGGPALAQSDAADIVASVRAAAAVPDFARAEALLADYQSAHGDTPDAMEALSWMGRGALAAGDTNRAFLYAADTQARVEALLGARSLADDVHLQTALGAAIETQALARVARGDRSDAVYFLTRQLERYRDTAIDKRLEKNIDLLSLEGQPAPPLAATEYLGAPVPSLADLKGRVVLLFFWAHWCPDCKAESPIIQTLLDRYRNQGLSLIAPTTRFGYIVAGQPTTPDAELQHIIEVRDTYYAFLRGEPVPLDEVNHKRYGVSSTPTIALVDRDGIVRLYHPGRMTEAELDAAIRGLL